MLKVECCLEGMTLQQVMQKKPETCDDEQWKQLVEYWFNEDVRILKNFALILFTITMS